MGMESDLTFPFCPQPPHWSLDWQGIQDAFVEIRKLAGCPQDPIFHAEGDVLTHTRMVCEALVESDGWRSLESVNRSIVFAATMLHDIAKPLCTKHENDRITSRGHSAKGAQKARSLFWTLRPDQSSAEFFSMREAVVGLVRHHGLPLYFMDRAEPQRAVIEASMTAHLDWVSLLAEADVRGRICEDQSELLDRIAMFREFAAESKCLQSPYSFASEQSRFRYFRSEDQPAELDYFDDTMFEVTLMSGLPASGKDTWVADNVSNMPAISLDDLREELGISPDDNQGRTANEARERAKSLLRKKCGFVWNATNTTRILRRQLIDLFTSYRARVRIVYVETSVEELARRNRNRNNHVPEDVISKLRRRLDVPDLTEAQTVEYVFS